MNNASTLDAYETYLRSWHASDTTISARMTLAKARLAEWGVKGMTQSNIEGFLGADRAGNPRSRWTTATYHNHLTDLCGFLVAAGLLEESPMPGIKRAKRPVRRPRPITEPEIARVMAVVQGEVRDWILLALLAGLRASEIAAISGESFTDDGITLIGKGDKEATLPCHPHLAEMATRYPAIGYWFPGNQDGHIRGQTVSMTVGRLFKSMGIEGSIHKCRHAYGTSLVRKGVNIRVVQRLMRHSSLETTAGYLAVVSDEERDAIALLSA